MTNEENNIKSGWRSYPGIIEIEKSKVLSNPHRKIDKDIDLALRAVAFEMDVLVKKICASRKTRDQADARSIVVWLIVKRYKLEYKEELVFKRCGIRFNKDRIAVRHSYEKACNLLDVSADWEHKVDMCQKRFNVEIELQ